MFIPVSSKYLTVDRFIKVTAEDIWRNSPNCKCTKLFFESYDTAKTKFLMQESRSGLGKMMSIITGHNLLGKHAKRLRLIADDNCRYCESLDCSEDTQHILCQCEAVARRRCKTLGTYFFDIEEDLSKLKLQYVKKFFADIGCNPRTVSVA